MQTTNQNVGQIERATQNRVVALFRERLGYEYLGDWEERLDNSNIEEEYLSRYLIGTKAYSEATINKAITEIKKVADDQQHILYEINKNVYNLLRYGVQVQEELGEHPRHVHFIDWDNPQNNHFAIAEEVTVRGAKTKRPDIVLYINGIALGVIELKRSTVSVSQGIRQNIGNQSDKYIKNFFATMQIVMAGNDTEGLLYGTIETPEEFYVKWKEVGYEDYNRIDKALLQFCNKERFLEIIHNFIVFDSGNKIIGRHNQYFGVRAAQEYIKRKEGGIIWHTQGSGKSLTMVWLAKWIRENVEDPRVLLLTDRVELDEQIEKVFNGVDERLYRAKNGRDLINKLNAKEEWLIGSLVHKFGRVGSEGEADVEGYMADLRRSIPVNFEAKGNIFVFVDECHRSHGGVLHKAMREVLPNATFIGFTGTPLLKIDKDNSIALWGSYIHTYLYKEAVIDKVVLDLRYDPRKIPQEISDQGKIDEYFESKTSGLTEYAKGKLKQKWGTMQTLLSSAGRMKKIAFDILDDFELKSRLASGRGNAMLVASSIYEACQYYEIFQSQGFTKCAVITSYIPGGLNTNDREYAIYERMLTSHGPIERKTDESEMDAFERVIKSRFVKEPAQMQLLIVVDKLLTGFDAPHATYLYIDKNMQDHGLFQAICRVNRIDDEDKEYGHIVDYRDLFKKLESALVDYSGAAFAGFNKEDVIGLLKDNIEEGKKDLDEALEVVRGLCELVMPPKRSIDYIKYFCGDVENPYSLKENEVKRVRLYRSVSHLVRTYAELANEMGEAGYSREQTITIADDVRHFESVKKEVTLASGDYIDLKKYEPAMRTLMDRYITASESEQLTAFNDMTLIDLIVEKGTDAFGEFPESMRSSEEAIAETIENNVRRLIIDETPTNPKYYQKMSELLIELIRMRKQEDLQYEQYLKQIVELTRNIRKPEDSLSYPSDIVTRGQKALYDNLEQDKAKVLALHESVMAARMADFRGNAMRSRAVKNAIRRELPDFTDEEVEKIFEIIVNQHEY